jgi:carboxypeptidase C (cathepsin A)
MARVLFAFLLFISLFAEEKISTHTIQLETETLTYTAAVGTGDVSYIAYTKEGTNRPITFAFNGGPGSSSVWLHMGSFGPRRLVGPEEGQRSTPPYQIIDNPETILDLTDIVFIDPAGTGLSDRKANDENKAPYSIEGDIRSVGDFIRDYLTSHKRWNSPKYLAGESYGALRASGLAEYLQGEYGIYLNGIIFVSAAIDYQTFIFDPDNPLPYFLFLPTYATTAWYYGHHPETTLEEIAQRSRDFIYDTYAPSLICQKCFDLAPIHDELSALTGLPLPLIQRHHGKITDNLFWSELLANDSKQVGRFDSRCSGYRGTGSFFEDPSVGLIDGIFAGAFHDYLLTELNYSSSYRLFASDVHNQWNYRNYNFWGYPNLMGALRKALVINPSTKIFVGCGYFDLATPFAATEYCFDHLDVPNISVQMEYYEGGHMYYLNPSARKKFKQDLTRFYEQ